MKEIEVGGLRVHLSEGCGGIWFDKWELEKFDEPHEEAGQELLELMAKYQKQDIDLEQRLRSPRDPNVTMMRRFWSVKQQVEIDECPATGGIWLDAGELARIREMFSTEDERRSAGKAFIKGMLENSAAVAEARGQSEEAGQKARRFANMFKFICPSYYIPGDQDWGAF
ncbi:MAG: zf-TFIIB domain-containing protein [Candidatus Omnitrophica bacterium]|nr:zf-TFIIB domain-containing protein [Candidatus Omnitrophota bacterium]